MRPFMLLAIPLFVVQIAIPSVLARWDDPPGSESWRLTFESQGSIPMELPDLSSTASTRCKGSATLHVAPDGQITGSGQLEYALRRVTESDLLPGDAVTNERGEGSFRVEGFRRSGFLVFTFVGTVPTSSTTTIVGLTQTGTGAFSSGSVAFQQQIERRDGAKARSGSQQHQGSAGPFQFALSVEFQLSLLSGEVQPDPAPTPEPRQEAPAASNDGSPCGPEHGERWTLELSASYAHRIAVAGVQGTSRSEGHGEVRFRVPAEAGGRVREAGPFHSSESHSYPGGDMARSGEGSLLLDGVIQDGKLRFVPFGSIERETTDSAAIRAMSSYESGRNLLDLPEVVIPLEDGARLVQKIADSEPIPGRTITENRIVWRLERVVREIWLVEIEEWHVMFVNRGSSIAHGLRFHLLTKLTVETEDTGAGRQIVASSGTREIKGVETDSVPPGAFSISRLDPVYPDYGTFGLGDVRPVAAGVGTDAIDGPARFTPERISIEGDQLKARLPDALAKGAWSSDLSEQGRELLRSVYSERELVELRGSAFQGFAPYRVFVNVPLSLEWEGPVGPGGTSLPDASAGASKGVKRTSEIVARVKRLCPAP